MNYLYCSLDVINKKLNRIYTKYNDKIDYHLFKMNFNALQIDYIKKYYKTKLSRNDLHKLYELSGSNLIHNYYNILMILKQFTNQFKMLSIVIISLIIIYIFPFIFSVFIHNIFNFEILSIFIAVLVFFLLMEFLVYRYYFPYLNIVKKLSKDNIKEVTLNIVKIKRVSLNPLERYHSYAGFIIYGVDNEDRKRKLFYPVFEKRFKNIKVKEKQTFKVIENVVLRG